MKKDSIGNRMKENYEHRTRIKLTRRTPVIIRLDGKAFHTLTRNCNKPFDKHFQKCMIYTAFQLCDEIQGAKCAYVQSDEISILLTDFDRLSTDAWFDYNLQKITSISAAMASVFFTNELKLNPDFINKNGFFDSRAFNIPKEEVCNYFIWRQQDWVRNSLQMLCQSKFSHKQLHKKNSKDMHEMLYTKNINWAKLPDVDKNGTFIYYKNDWKQYSKIIFQDDRDSIETYLEVSE